MDYIAHRGGAGFGPENTLAAMRQALAAGATCIEIDVYAVEDTVVVFHDNRLERTTNGRGRIADSTLHYLRSLDAGGGERIPLLTEVLELIGRRARLNIELKGLRSAEPTLALLRQCVAAGTNGWEDFLVSSFDHRQLLSLRQWQPDLPLGILVTGPSLHYARDGASLGARSVHVAAEYVDADFIADAHGHGLRVLVYTVNDAEEMARMAALGVDAVFTDRLPPTAGWGETMFKLHRQLAQDCFELGNFPLCRLLLMNDSNYPWFILVPQRNDIHEIFQLAEADQHQLLRESSHLARVLDELFAADKINVAALGNVVPQLHIHHIVRYRGDPAWPAPVWGRVTTEPYTDAGVALVLERLRGALGEGFVFGGVVADEE